MTFVVNAIKQDDRITDNYTFLVNVDSEQIGRDIIEKTGMLLLSISRYPNSPLTFGDIYVKVMHEDLPYEIVSPTSFTLKELCMFFVRCGMDVVDVNSYVDQQKQTQEQVDRIISLCKTNNLNEIISNKLQKERQIEEQKKSKYYEDRMLSRAKVSIVWVLDKIQMLSKIQHIDLSIKDQKWIEGHLNEIKKQRMGSNYEKIKIIMQELFVFLASLEDAYYSKIQGTGTPIFNGTHISTIDLQKQVEILESVKYRSLFGGDVLDSRKQYATFPILPYFVFLKKDFIYLFSDTYFLIYVFYDMSVFFLISILLMLSCLFLFHFLFAFEVQLISLYYSFLILGWFGFLLHIASFFRKNKTFFFSFGLLISVIIVYFVTLPLIENSFALQ